LTIADTDRLEEIREAHLDLSVEDWRFRDAARQSPELLSRASFGILDQPNDLISFRLQSWPTFVRRSKIQELSRVSIAVSSLIRSIPRKVFRDDPAAMARFYGFDNLPLLEILLDPPNGIPGAVSRGDFIYGARGFQCIEFNILPNVGGWESGILAEMHMSNAATASLISHLGIHVSHVNTTRELFAHILEEARREGLDPEGEINIAMFSADRKDPQKRASFGRHLREEYRTVLSGEGGGLQGDVFICGSEELALQRHQLFHGGSRIHAVVEMERNTDQKVFRCFKAGCLNLYNGPVWQMLSDKRNIALLSDESLDTDFTADERSFLQRHVPWTRLVRPERTGFRDERVFLPDLLEARREELVVKNSLLYGGKEVYVGLYTSPAEWAEVVRKALASQHWVAQEYIPSNPYLYQNGDYGCSPHNVIWGPFVFGERYGGAILRMQPMADTTVVNLSLTATEGLIFEVDD
jgi:hypothetical protein